MGLTIIPAGDLLGMPGSKDQSGRVAIELAAGVAATLLKSARSGTIPLGAPFFEIRPIPDGGHLAFPKCGDGCMPVWQTNGRDFRIVCRCGPDLVGDKDRQVIPDLVAGTKFRVSSCEIQMSPTSDGGVQISCSGSCEDCVTLYRRGEHGAVLIACVCRVGALGRAARPTRTTERARRSRAPKRGSRAPRRPSPRTR